MAARTALVVVDMQKAFDDASYWGRRNNPDCERNVADLIESWRDQAQPVVFVRHDDSDEEVSPLRPDEAGNAFKDVIGGEPDLLVSKRVNSAFHGDPDLEQWLTDNGIEGIVVCGITDEPLLRDDGPGGRQPRLRDGLRDRRDTHLRPRRPRGRHDRR